MVLVKGTNMSETPRLVGHPKDLKRHQRGFVKTYWKRSCFVVVLVKAVCCASTLAEGQTVGLLECKRRLDIGTGKLSRHRTFPVA